MTRPPSALRQFFRNEASGGLVLITAAALALLVANTPLSGLYFGALHAPLGGMDVHHWVNDGLMALFFLLVGLEIKREWVDGELSSWRRRVLPGVGALGGMAVPALIYVVIQQGDPATLRGWAIPAATDIAFALGILSLLGRRVPVSLKIFLTALAIPVVGPGMGGGCQRSVRSKRVYGGMDPSPNGRMWEMRTRPATGASPPWQGCLRCLVQGSDPSAACGDVDLRSCSSENSPV